MYILVWCNKVKTYAFNREFPGAYQRMRRIGTLGDLITYTVLQWPSTRCSDLVHRFATREDCVSACSWWKMDLQPAGSWWISPFWGLFTTYFTAEPKVRIRRKCDKKFLDVVPPVFEFRIDWYKTLYLFSVWQDGKTLIRMHRFLPCCTIGNRNLLFYRITGCTITLTEIRKGIVEIKVVYELC